MRAANLAFLVSLLTAGAVAAAVTRGGAVAETADGPALSVAAAPAIGVPAGPSGEPDSPLASFSYYTVLGSQLQPRSSTTTFVYASNGCMYETAGDARFAFPLLLPSGSIVKYLRIYFNDTSAGSNLTAWITRYDPGVGSLDLTSVLSTGSAGYGTALSAELTETFASDENYTLTVGPGAFDTTNQICGLRVAYYAPRIFRDDFETADTSRWSLVVP